MNYAKRFRVKPGSKVDLEDVLVVRVHNIVPKDVWSERYEQINDFEKTLHANGTHILKFLPTHRRR